jgi:NAD(P)-dependent dehydrogenase (short-subunit alcohol dehydrogenase family)
MADHLIITGASAGIGLATAQHFLEQGFRVVNLSRRPCPLPAVQNFAVDLADGTMWEAVSEPLRQAVASAERIILIHNAALLPGDTVATVDAATLRTVMEVNIVAPTILNRLLLPLMRPGSAILYVGSTLSEKGVAGQLSYVTAKHALVGLMRATCQDLMGKQVHTACICPGLTDTEMLRQRAGNNEALLDFFRNMSSENRLVQPQEIAAVLYFAAMNSVINGTVLHANLGQKEH